MTCLSTSWRQANKRVHWKRCSTRSQATKKKPKLSRRKIKKALFYPTAVLAVALIVTVILLVFVIPQFESLFKGFGADLPAFTQMVVNMSRFMQHEGWIPLIVIGAGVYTFSYFHKRSRTMRRNIDRAMLKFPIIGPILVKAAIARFCPYSGDHVRCRRAFG